MSKPFKLQEPQSIAISAAVSKHIENRTIDFKAGSIFVVDPNKYIETGHLHSHIRVSTNFIVVESVLYGFAKNFLDAVTIYTLEGCKVNNIFRIRANTYENGSSQTAVTKFLKEYLHTKENIDTHLANTIEELYDIAFQNQFYEKLKQK